MTDFSPASYIRGAQDAIRAGNLDDALSHLVCALAALEPGEDKRPTKLLLTDRENFDTLMRAAANDDVVLLHLREKATGHGHAVLAIKSIVPGSDDVDMIPVARMLDEDPTETYVNPTED